MRDLRPRLIDLVLRRAFDLKLKNLAILNSVGASVSVDKTTQETTCNPTSCAYQILQRYDIIGLDVENKAVLLILV